MPHPEQTELSGLLGGLGWKCEHTGPQHSAATGLERSKIEQATVQDMIEASRLLQQVKNVRGKAICFFSCPTEERVASTGRRDAALQNRVMAEGEEALMSVISWRSSRKDRVCRSATCAETRPAVDLEDELFALRYQWSEMMGNTPFENALDENGTPGTWCMCDGQQGACKTKYKTK